MVSPVLVPHDPAWAEEFGREAGAIAAALGDVLLEVHHIGSTAIPRIVAKPVIDILAVVTAAGPLDGRAPRLEALGYRGLGELGIAGRRYFRKERAPGIRTHHVHAFAAGSPEIRRHLDFRDYLRTHRDAAKAYAALKRDLARRHPGDRRAYSEGKTEFIRDIERRAARSSRAGARPSLS